MIFKAIEFAAKAHSGQYHFKAEVARVFGDGILELKDGLNVNVNKSPEVR